MHERPVSTHAGFLGGPCGHTGWCPMDALHGEGSACGRGESCAAEKELYFQEMGFPGVPGGPVASHQRESFLCSLELLPIVDDCFGHCHCVARQEVTTSWVC